MALVALDGTPLVAIGNAGRLGTIVLPAAIQTLQDATLEACHMIGQIFTEDGGSHTIDTTGSSSFGYRTGAVTFANGGSSFKVGLATLDTANGPAGRATNSTDTITFSVSKTYTGGGGTPTANAWQEVAPGAGSMTIANGDYVAFCTQMVVRAGADAINTTAGSAATAASMPNVTGFTSSAYAAVTAVPNAVITFSDGTLGFFYGGAVFTTPSTTVTWNNGSALVEYGNFFQLPVPVKVYGIIAGVNMVADTDLVLYSAPLGTPVAEKTVSLDANTIGTNTSAAPTLALFASPYSATASQPLAAIIKPTTTTNIQASHVTFNAAAHQKSLTLGANGYAVNRASGAFAAQNSSKDRFAVGLLVGAFDNGVSAASGISRARAAAGF